MLEAISSKKAVDDREDRRVRHRDHRGLAHALKSIGRHIGEAGRAGGADDDGNAGFGSHVSSCMLVSAGNHSTRIVWINKKALSRHQVTTRIPPPASISAACGAHQRQWTLLVVRDLGNGPLRFNALKREIGEVSQKMLHPRCAKLEENGFVTRTVTPTMPPQVEYELTISAATSGPRCSLSPIGWWPTAPHRRRRNAYRQR